MNTTLSRTWAVVCLSALTSTGAFRVSADQPTTADKPAKTYTGIVAAVDAQEHVLKVNGWLSSKSFNLGSTCSYAFLENRSGALPDLRPGQKVAVRYQNASGVLVADRVVQQPLRFEGTVKAVDAEKRVLTVHVTGKDKTFQLPGDCKIVLRNDKSGTLAEVLPGHHVTVTYEIPNDLATAREIAQTSARFTGELTAIDLTDRTVKAKAAFGAKKFHLADRCAILLSGKPKAELRDLKPGDKLTFSYDEVNGVNVVNRIANDGGSPETETAEVK